MIQAIVIALKQVTWICVFKVNVRELQIKDLKEEEEQYFLQTLLFTCPFY